MEQQIGQMRVLQRRQRSRGKLRPFFFPSTALCRVKHRRPWFGEVALQEQGSRVRPSCNSLRCCTGRKTVRKSKALRRQQLASRRAAAIAPLEKAQSVTRKRRQ